MLTSRPVLVSFLGFTLLTSASPLNEIEKRQDDGIAPLTKAQINAFNPFTHFASAAYCQPAVTKTWKCGANCKANSDFIPIASGGDGSNVQFWYVGYSPSQKTAIVAHQGTDPNQNAAIITDTNVAFTNLDSTLFPGVPRSIQVHEGFANVHAQTATQILAAVRTAFNDHGATKVTMVGHSLGGALALLDSVYLPLHITRSGITYRTVTYGCPRVGNKPFANYVDANTDFTHINNKKDPVPTLPGMFMNYVGASGEIHIRENNNWVSCPGQDNPSVKCSTGDVPNIGAGNLTDHTGPYNGISMTGC